MLHPEHLLGAAVEQCETRPVRIGGDEGGVAGARGGAVGVAQDDPFDELARRRIRDGGLDLRRLSVPPLRRPSIALRTSATSASDVCGCDACRGGGVDGVSVSVTSSASSGAAASVGFAPPGAPECACFSPAEAGPVLPAADFLSLDFDADLAPDFDVDLAAFLPAFLPADLFSADLLAADFFPLTFSFAFPVVSGGVVIASFAAALCVANQHAPASRPAQASATARADWCRVKSAWSPVPRSDRVAPTRYARSRTHKFFSPNLGGKAPALRPRCRHGWDLRKRHRYRDLREDFSVSPPWLRQSAGGLSYRRGLVT